MMAGEERKKGKILSIKKKFEQIFDILLSCCLNIDNKNFQQQQQRKKIVINNLHLCDCHLNEIKFSKNKNLPFTIVHS